jgi:hypothetical protein
MRNFWVLAQKKPNGITARKVYADSPELAIKLEFGIDVHAASPFKFDFCTQESDENGYLYWLASGSDGATLRSGSTEASKLN